MQTLRDLPNIGAVLEEQLKRIGIDTPEKLRETGSREVWLMIQQFDPSACLSRLNALEGAIQGVRWHDLDKGVRGDLKAFYDAH